MLVEPANKSALAERFHNFDDGVVAEVELTMAALPRKCAVTVICQDRQSPSGWSKVRFDIYSVTEFRFQCGDKGTFEVLSGGIQLAWRDDRVYVVFDAYPD